MSNKKVRRLSTAAKNVAEVLSVHPDGLQFYSLLERAAPGSIEGDEVVERDIRRGAIAMIKAGWIVIDGGRWKISEKGSRAHARYTDPDKFLLVASRQSLRGWLAIQTPLYLYGVKSLEKLSIEYRAIRRIGLRQFFGRTLRTEKWQDILPVQAPRRWVFPKIQIRTLEQLIDHLELTAAPFFEGGHSVYLPPDSLNQSAFGKLTRHYPAGCGLKILKKPGGVATSSYALSTTPGDSRVHVNLIHRPKHLALVACLFFMEGVGPRLYDFVELQAGDQLWTAYVVEHVHGRTPTHAECEAGIAKLRMLEQQGLVTVLLPEGFDDAEFECPSCSSNALMSLSGSFYYVDFQNFLLTDHEAYLTKVAHQAAESSHFGDESFLRGGRYLYQTIPGVNMPGKRDTFHRSKALQGLMEEADASVSDRLVLDIGCNIGMMMAQYLKMGAAWCHGWDRARMLLHTEHVLLALGCTRFSITGADIFDGQPLEDDLPQFLKPALDGCVISYLAMRGHVGWLRALARIPWSFMLYEGHEDETAADFEQHINELREMVDFSVAGFRYYVDGDSDLRAIALLKRDPDRKRTDNRLGPFVTHDRSAKRADQSLQDSLTDSIAMRSVYATETI
jgi:hypothetical protein